MGKQILYTSGVFVLAMSMWAHNAHAIVYKAWNSPYIHVELVLETSGPGADVDITASGTLIGFCRTPTAAETSCKESGSQGNRTVPTDVDLSTILSEGSSGHYEGTVYLLEYMDHLDPNHIHTCSVPDKIELLESFAVPVIVGTWERLGKGKQRESGEFQCVWTGGVDEDSCMHDHDATYVCEQTCRDSKNKEIPCSE